MQYILNKRNIKQSLHNLTAHLKEKGYNVPRHILLDALARVFFFKNYNTLDGVISTPKVIDTMSAKRVYMLEIESSLEKEVLLAYVRQSLRKANCSGVIDHVLYESGYCHIELVFDHHTHNFLTAMMLLGEQLKTQKVTRFDMLRFVVEKENLIGLTTLP